MRPDVTHAPRTARALALLGLALAVPAWSEEDARLIVQKAFEAAKANEVEVRDYVFHERVEERRFNRKGEEKKRQSSTWDVTLYETGDYRRLIARNDEPLDRAAEQKEQRRLDRHLRQLQNETPRERARRVAKVEKERRESEEFLEEITEAFDFRLIGREEVGGVESFVISAEPRDGYEPPNRQARVLTKVRATMWVSREDYGWVQADIETLDNISWMAIFRLNEGAQIRFEQRRVDDEVWIIERWHVRLRARIALVYRLDAEWIGTYSNFRRFVTDTTETGWTRAD